MDDHERAAGLMASNQEHARQIKAAARELDIAIARAHGDGLTIKAGWLQIGTPHGTKPQTQITVLMPLSGRP